MYDCPQNDDNELFHCIDYLNLISKILILMTGISLNQNSTFSKNFMSRPCVIVYSVMISKIDIFFMLSNYHLSMSILS